MTKRESGFSAQLDRTRATEEVPPSVFEERYGAGSQQRLIALLEQPCVTFATIATHFGVSRERVRQWHRDLLARRTDRTRTSADVRAAPAPPAAPAGPVVPHLFPTRPVSLRGCDRTTGSIAPWIPNPNRTHWHSSGCPARLLAAFGGGSRPAAVPVPRHLPNTFTSAWGRTPSFSCLPRRHGPSGLGKPQGHQP